VATPALAGHVRDGRFDRWVNRRISRHLSPRLAGTWVHPNHVTIAAIILAIGGAALVAVGGYWIRLLGLAGVQLSSVLDCCDGELARLTSRESRSGEWLDVIGDTVGHLALFLAVGVAAARDGLPHGVLFAAVLGLGALCSFVCVTWAERTSARRALGGGRLDRRIDGLVLALSTRDYHAVVFVCAVVDRFDWFLWGAAIGSHVFWVTVAVLMRTAGKGRACGATDYESGSEPTEPTSDDLSVTKSGKKGGGNVR
jgi:phosphatidylglycerophosphate synthase